MKNTLGLGMLMMALVAPGIGYGQGPIAPAAPFGSPGLPAPIAQDGPPAGSPVSAPIATAPGAEPAAGTGEQQPAAPTGFSPLLHDYLTYLRPCGCCGPVGKDGPIVYEIYTRHGMSVPIGNSFFGEVLKPGYSLQAGARTLFFEPSNTTAWVIDLGIRSTWYDAHGRRQITQFDIDRNVQIGNQTIPIVIPELLVTPSSCNQTAVTLSVGNEWYLSGPAACCSKDSPLGWRVGYDLGGIWGSTRVIYREITHGNDVIKGLFLALHSDVECPYKCCILVGGLRTEFSYTRSQVLQRQNDSSLVALNILANLGIRW
ncbi:MAG: hypothetical protein U0736_24575 [Gemmataceae bacterium]